MPAVRPARQRTVTNENDENGTQRMTRAKAAAQSTGSDASQPLKKPLQSKKPTTQAGQPKKRAALGDISNANKGDNVERVDGKKPTGLVSKASQQAQKSAKPSARPVLGSKDRNAPGNNDLKRAASTAPAGPGSRKRNKSDSSRRTSNEEDDEVSDENAEPAPSNVQIEVTETKVKTKSPAVAKSIVESAAAREERLAVEQLAAEEKLVNDELAAKIEEMDEEDASDPLMVSEYVYEIVEYMKELETRTMPSADYMDTQDHLDWRMRGVLVDWLLEVHTRFHLLPETFYLTVNLIDRFLSNKQVNMDRLQLVGVTAMFIASKYEEVLSPHINNFVHVADDGFSESEILHAERFMLQTLDFDISFPNPMHFMRRISKADNYDIQTRTLAKYLLEISLLDHRFLQYKPSVNAAASMYLSRVILHKGEWDDVLVHYSGYTEDEIRPAVSTMIEYLKAPVVHNAFYKKYAGKKFLKASLHARAWAKRVATAHQDTDASPQTP